MRSLLSVRSLLLILLLLSGAHFPSSASAQVLPKSLRIAEDLTLSIASAPLPLVPLESEQLRHDLNRSRLMLAAGVGLALGGVAGILVGAKQERGEYGEQSRLMGPLLVGSFAASIGFGFSIAGGRRLSAIPDDYRERHRAPPGPLLLGLGLLASTVLIVLALAVPEGLAVSAD